MTAKWSNKRVLVTGAGGFIGSHLVENLLSAGATVRAFVRYNSRGDPGLLRMLPSAELSQVEIIAGDLQDEFAVRKAVEGIQIVFHLGAMVSIPYSYRHPVEVAKTNFIGTLNILTASREHEVERLVHTSSSEVYGTALQVPISESHPLQGQSPYSASKIGADKLVESFFCAFELPVVTVRPFNTYGPRQSSRAIIPTIITQALTRNAISLGNLNTIRDFTFVDDTVAGLMRAAEVSGVIGKEFNLGTGQEIKIGELVQKIISKIGRQVEIIVDPVRLRPDRSEVLRLLSDNALARKKLRWKPDVSLDDGLDITIAWMKTHLDLYQIGSYEF
jgi:NAD dependent epimerase/dehydratase